MACGSVWATWCCGEFNLLVVQFKDLLLLWQTSGNWQAATLSGFRGSFSPIVKVGSVQQS